MTANTDLTKDIFELLRRSDVPMTAKQVALKAFGSTSSGEIEKVTGVFNRLKTRGAAFEFPPERAGQGTRFGLVSPTDWLAQRIVTTVKEAGGRLTLRRVRDSLRKWETMYFDEALGKLFKDEKLFYLTVKFKYVLSSPPDPSDYLLPRQVTSLQEILERINRHRKAALTIEELKKFLNGSNLTEVLPVAVSGKLLEDLLREWYNKDLPRRGGLASVPIPWTWSHYESWCISNKAKPDLEQFQDFMWSLHQVGKIEFISHSMTQSLPDREAEIALKGQHGEVFYYWKWR